MPHSFTAKENDTDRADGVRVNGHIDIPQMQVAERAFDDKAICATDLAMPAACATNATS